MSMLANSPLVLPHADLGMKMMQGQMKSPAYAVHRMQEAVTCACTYESLGCVSRCAHDGSLLTPLPAVT
eukprot:365076-Chlamydomonas_euryale.AAC.6